MSDDLKQLRLQAEIDEIAITIANMADKTTSAYVRACDTLIESMYKYLLKYDEKAVLAFADTFVDTLKKSIHDFTPENGQFSHYFNHRWKLAKSGEVYEEDDRGVGETKWDRRCVRKYHKLVAMIQAEDSHISQAELDQRVADAMDVSVETVRKYAATDNMTVASDNQVGDDGEGYSLIDKFAFTPGVEAQLVKTDGLTPLFEVIETTFDGLQNRSKPLMAAALTKALAELGLKPVGYAFYDEETYRLYLDSGKKLSGRELASRFGKDEAHLSRAWSSFKEKLQAAYEEKTR